MVPKERRVGTALFSETMRKGASARGAFFTVRVRPIMGPSKVAVTVPKKVAKSAVERNTLRRRYSAPLEAILPLIKDGFSLIFFISEARSQAEFSKEARQALDKMKMFS